MAGAENKVQKFLKGRRMARSTGQNRLEQPDGFLRQTVARKQIHVGKRLSDEFLRFFVQLVVNRFDRSFIGKYWLVWTEFRRFGLRNFPFVGPGLGFPLLSPCPPPPFSSQR